MRRFVIINPTTSRAGEFTAVLKKNSWEHEFQWCPTKPDLTALQLARQAVDEGYTRIVVIGGDGTVNQVINGMAPEFSAELAVVPTGTGNDLARSIGLMDVAPENAFRQALVAPAITVDVMHVTADKSLYCMNVANGGLGGCIAEEIHSDDKQRWGQLAYWFTCLSKFGNLQMFQVELGLDEQQTAIETPGLAIANGRYVAGGFPIAPQAFLNDGLLNVNVAPGSSPALMAAGVNFAMGRHQFEERVKSFQARKVRIRSKPPMPFSIDGEPVRSFDATFQVLPNAVKLVMGKNPVAYLSPSNQSVASDSTG